MAFTDAFLRALGRVTVNFAQMESFMGFSIGSLVSSEQGVGAIVAAELSFRNKCGVLSSLFQLRVEEAARPDEVTFLDEMKAILKRASQLEARRNQITHSTWLVGEDDPPDQVTRMKVTARQDRGLRHLTQPVTVVSLNALADEIKTMRPSC